MSPEAKEGGDPIGELEQNTENVQLLVNAAYDMSLRGSAFSSEHPDIVKRIADMSAELGVPEIAADFAAKAVMDPALKAEVYSSVYGPGNRGYYEDFAEEWLKAFGGEDEYLPFHSARSSFESVLSKAEDKAPLLELCTDVNNPYLLASLYAVYAGETTDAEILELAVEQCEALMDSTARRPSLGMGYRMTHAHVWGYIYQAAEKLGDEELTARADAMLEEAYELEHGHKPGEQPMREDASPAEGELLPASRVLGDIDTGKIDEAAEGSKGIKDIFLKAQLLREIYLATDDPQYLRLALLSLSFEDVPEEEVKEHIENEDGSFSMTIFDAGNSMLKEGSTRLSEIGAENGFIKEVDELPFVHGAVVEAYRYLELLKAGKKALARQAVEQARELAHEGDETVFDLAETARITGLDEAFEDSLESALRQLEENYGFEDYEVEKKHSLVLLKSKSDKPKDENLTRNLARGIRKLSTHLVKTEGVHSPRLARLRYGVQCTMNSADRTQFEGELFSGILDAIQEPEDPLEQEVTPLFTLSGMFMMVPRNRN
ncbi:MAG TPA: hypothetical protein VFW77_01880 [Candidatus Saccharimonadales bacterium]|nr:hypothetical protein [Candidatus Saccharimonadales bacterium]